MGDKPVKEKVLSFRVNGDEHDTIRAKYNKWRRTTRTHARDFSAFLRGIIMRSARRR